MKKIPARHVAILLPGLLASCNVFSPVDPLPPVISALEIVEVKRNEITVNGTISEPDFKNSRQVKKSGPITEYGVIYSTDPDVDVATDAGIALGTSGSFPISVQNGKVSGLAANTQYYVALYARNEGGGVGYSKVINVKTSDEPVIAVSRASVSLSNNDSAPYDLDGGKVVTSTDTQKDITFSWFNISGRGTVLQIDATGGAILKNLGVTNFAAVSYLNLINIPDFSNESISVLMNATSTNSVIAFETKEGRYGKLRLESANDNALVISLVTYEK